MLHWPGAVVVVVVSGRACGATSWLITIYTCHTIITRNMFVILQETAAYCVVATAVIPSHVTPTWSGRRRRRSCCCWRLRGHRGRCWWCMYAMVKLHHGWQRWRRLHSAVSFVSYRIACYTDLEWLSSESSEVGCVRRLARAQGLCER